MNETRQMSADTTELRTSRAKFEREMMQGLGGYMKGASLQLSKVDGVSQFTINSYPYLGSTLTHIIGQWSNGKGTYCNKALAYFKR